MATKSSDLDRVQRLFELAEVEKDPARKHAALDEALGLVDVYVEDETLASSREGDPIRDASWRNSSR